MERICEYDLEMEKNNRKQLLRISRELECTEADYNLHTGAMVMDFFRDNYNLHLKSEEYVYLVAADKKCHVLGILQIAHGTVDHAFVGQREIAIRMLLLGAVNGILIHNHPSGDAKPSKEDYRLTGTIEKMFRYIGLRLLDHVIIGRDSYFSMLENGMMNKAI